MITESKKIILVKSKTKYEYPLQESNCTLYRKNGRNPKKVYGYWDGYDSLEIFRNSDDGGSSIATICLIGKDAGNTIWYECRKAKPDVTGYKIKITRPIQDVLNPDKIILESGLVFTGFNLIFCGEETNCE